MYRRLQPYLQKFVCIHQGMLGRTYAGRMLHIDSECVEIQTYKADGARGELWTVSMATITDFLTDSEQLNTLALKVQWAISSEEREDVTGAQQQQACS